MKQEERVKKSRLQIEEKSWFKRKSSSKNEDDLVYIVSL